MTDSTTAELHDRMTCNRWVLCEDHWHYEDIVSCTCAASTTDKVELLPCPFCGSINIGFAISKGSRGYHDQYDVCCDDCGASTDLFHDKQQAVEKWNTRAQHVQSVDARAAAEEVFNHVMKRFHATEQLYVSELEAIITRNVHSASLTDAIEAVRAKGRHWWQNQYDAKDSALIRAKAEAAFELAEELQSLEGKPPEGDSKFSNAALKALKALEPYLSTRAQLLDYASLNEGRASGFDTASMKAREALALAATTPSSGEEK